MTTRFAIAHIGTLVLATHMFLPPVWTGHLGVALIVLPYIHKGWEEYKNKKNG